MPRRKRKDSRPREGKRPSCLLVAGSSGKTGKETSGRAAATREFLFVPHGEKRFRQAETPIPVGSLGGVPSVDRDGRILLPSSEGLLLRNANQWQRIDRASGLKGTVYSVFEDRQRTLWIGLAGRGLVRWSGYREWEKYTSDGGLFSDLIYEMLPDPDGSLWVGSEGGLFRGIRSRAGMKWLRVPGVPGFPVHSVRRSPAGDLWFGTETHGAGRIDRVTRKVEWYGEAEGLTAKAPYCLRFGRSGRLWAATDAGLFVAEAPYRRFSRIDALPASRFWNVTEGADGRIWTAGADGLFEFYSGHWTNYARASGLSNQEAMSIAAAPDGTIWVGYRFGNGIDRVRPSGSKISIERGVQRPGTLGIVYFLEFDAQGRLWAGTERGVDVWDGVRWSHYDSRDGLAWDDCDLNGFAAEQDGSVWIGTAGGLSHYTPRMSNPAAALPNTVFTRLTLGRTDVLGRNNPSAIGKSDAFRARFSVLNVRQTGNVLFRYRLMPSQSSWTETLQRELEFAELPPGAYRLQVDASDNDGKGGGRAADFSFVMPTPWQQSWWFLGLCALVPILAAGVAVRLRILAARRREHELVLIVEQKTTDLKRLNEDLLRLSSLDPLTGLANRRVFDRRISEECAQLGKTGFPVSMLILDIDCFKSLNDTHGHQRGDEYLTQVASALALIARPDRDIAARYGGEEFALILPRTNAGEAQLVAERVRLAVADLALPHPASPVADFLTVSVGVSTGTAERPASPETLIGAADQALYRAKRTGRNRSVAAENRHSDLDTLSSRLSVASYQPN